ncbi:hypothetical protein T484DRAFT_1764449 [Baffinella frigidus]|nr:hypothetical protein T484DRAFT_1764449 [Cryptophyta sp. CCMP2293]
MQYGATVYHTQHGVLSRRAVLDRILSGLESDLASYLEGYASSRALELSRIASRLVDAAREQVSRTSALLQRPGTEEACLPKLLELQDKQRGIIRDVRAEFARQLLELQDKQRGIIRDVRAEFARQREAVVQLAEEFFRGLADKHDI